MHIKNRIIIFSILLSFIFTGSLWANTSKDVILVLDTSFSMAGHGGKNIIDNVKKSIAKYIDSMENGDRVTFITFDKDVIIYPTVLVDDSNDREIIKKYISVTKAKGKWTYTLKMIQNVLSVADQLQKEKTGRDIKIIIMTDALDDPPPVVAKDKYDIKQIAKKYQGNDNWWIYFVNFGQLKKDSKVKAKRDALQKGLKRVSKNTSVITDETNPENVINKVHSDEKKGKSFLIPLGIAFFVLILLFVVIFFLKGYSDLKIVGKLEYWNNELLNPYVEVFDLTRLNLKEIQIGKKAGLVFSIRDLSAKGETLLSAVKDADSVNIAISVTGKTNLEFKNKEFDNFLKEGDIFQFGNYTFKYSVDV